MSYSRWHEDRCWPLSREWGLRPHPKVTAESLETAREYNVRRYHFQGIGRYEPDAAYARGLTDLGVLADLVPAVGYVHGANATSIVAAIYGFIANIYFYDIDTPLKRLVSARQNLVRHCMAIHETVMRGQPTQD